MEVLELQRSAVLIKNLHIIVNEMNNIKSLMIDLKLKDAIKLELSSYINLKCTLKE